MYLKKIIATLLTITTIVGLLTLNSRAAELDDDHKAVIERWLPLAIAYEDVEGIPHQAALSIFIHESGWQTSPAANDERHNGFGISVPGTEDPRTYSSLEESWGGFYRNLHQTAAYGEAGVFDHADDPYGCLMAIAGVYNTVDPDYKTKVTGVYKLVTDYEAELEAAAAAEEAEREAEEQAKAERHARIVAEAKVIAEELRQYHFAQLAQEDAGVRVPVAGASDLKHLGLPMPVAGATAEQCFIMTAVDTALERAEQAESLTAMAE